MLIAHDVHKCNGELVEDAALERVETSMVDIPLTFNLQISSSSWQNLQQTLNDLYHSYDTVRIGLRQNLDKAKVMSMNMYYRTRSR